jgi:hypothetical protein
VNPPTSASGEFIGDYQGLVADDKVAIPFWNDTQAANRAKGAKGFSPWQEVYAARIPNNVGGRCIDRIAPRTSLPRRNVSVDGQRRVSFHGTARDKGCKGRTKKLSVKGRVARVSVSVGRLEGNGQCRFLRNDGTFTETRSCTKRVLLPAQGKEQWTFSSSARLPSGTYRATASARDGAGNSEKPVFGRNTVKFTVR